MSPFYFNAFYNLQKMQVFLKKMGQSRPLFRLFSPLKQTLQILQKINVKNVKCIR